MRWTASSVALGTTCSPEALEATSSTARKAKTGCWPGTGQATWSVAVPATTAPRPTASPSTRSTASRRSKRRPLRSRRRGRLRQSSQTAAKSRRTPTRCSRRWGSSRCPHSHGKLIARAPVSCPAAEAGGCRTALTLETAKAVKLGKVRAVLVLGSATVNLAPGQRKTVSVRVNRRRRGLASHGKLSTRIQVSSSDAAGNTAAGTVAVGLRIPASLGTTPRPGGGPAERGASSLPWTAPEPD